MGGKVAGVVTPNGNEQLTINVVYLKLSSYYLRQSNLFAKIFFCFPFFLIFASYIIWGFPNC
jgi:TRAP-type mannitol/chloroaromatic compound transport system permease small subunit